MNYSDRTVEEIWQHHAQAVADRDVEAFLEDFAKDCVFITPKKVYRGHKEIAQWFENFLTMIDDAEFTSNGPIFERNVIFIKWDMLSRTHQVKAATDTFIIKNGRFETVTVDIDAIPRGNA